MLARPRERCLPDCEHKAEAFAPIVLGYLSWSRRTVAARVATSLRLRMKGKWLVRRPPLPHVMASIAHARARLKAWDRVGGVAQANEDWRDPCR